MTPKIQFILGCCAVFNCTPTVVLSALAGPVQPRDPHAGIKKTIRTQASRVTNHTLAEWKKISAKIEPHSDTIFNLATGRKLTALPLP
jgi:hypothetical protein